MKRNIHIAVALILVAAALAGCAAGGGQRVGNASTTNASASAPSTYPSAPTVPAGSTTTLYLTADLELTSAAPATEGSVPLTTPFNSPLTGDYPKWRGALPVALAAVRNVTIHLFVTSSSASIEANTLPIFADLPGMDATVGVGNASGTVAVNGPTLVRVGDATELVANFTIGKPPAAVLGAGASFQAIVYYSHAMGAAEFRFVVGGAHPSRVEVS